MSVDTFTNPRTGQEAYMTRDGAGRYHLTWSNGVEIGNGYATPEEVRQAFADRMADEDDTDRTPTVANVKRHAGIAGQFSVSADVTYPGEPTKRVEFVGSVYGGPVVAQFGDLPQQFVSDPGRFGSFADDPTAWVRRFFS